MGLVLNSSTWHYDSLWVIELYCDCVGVIMMMNERANTKIKSLYFYLCFVFHIRAGGSFV